MFELKKLWSFAAMETQGNMYTCTFESLHLTVYWPKL